MQENVSIVITMIVFVILLVIFPLYNYFERQDDMSYTLALKETSTFADDVLSKGYITEAMYGRLSSSLARTGNAYDVQMEAHKKILTKDPDNPLNPDILAEQPAVDYSNDINKILSSGGTYQLDQGDEFYVKLKNKNMTNAGAIFSSIIGKSSKETIAVNYGGMVKYNKWKEEETNQLIEGVNVAFQLIGQDYIATEQGIPVFTVSANNKIIYKATVGNVINTKNDIVGILRNNAALKFTPIIYKIDVVTGEEVVDQEKTIERAVYPSVTEENGEYKLVYNLDKSTYFSGDYTNYTSQDVYLKLSSGILNGINGSSNVEYISDKIVVLAAQ